jgi:hypothetical protein
VSPGRRIPASHVDTRTTRRTRNIETSREVRPLPCASSSSLSRVGAAFANAVPYPHLYLQQLMNIRSHLRRELPRSFTISRGPKLTRETEHTPTNLRKHSAVRPVLYPSSPLTKSAISTQRALCYLHAPSQRLIARRSDRISASHPRLSSGTLVSYGHSTQSAIFIRLQSSWLHIRNYQSTPFHSASRASIHHARQLYHESSLAEHPPSMKSEAAEASIIEGKEKTGDWPEVLGYLRP